MTRRAFTLIELVVAMSMVAILSVSLFAAMRVAFKAQSRSEAAIEPIRTADLAMELIGQDIQNIPPISTLAYAFTATDGVESRGHEGDNLVFFTTAEARQLEAANGDIKRVELAITTSPDGESLLVRRVTRNLFTNVTPEPDEEIVCRGVYGLNVRYFDGTDWQETWDAEQQGGLLPKAVEVTLLIDRKDDTPLRTMRVFRIPCAADPEMTAADTGVAP